MPTAATPKPKTSATPQTAPAPSRTVRPATTRPSTAAKAAPAPRPARPAVRLPKQPPRPAGEAKEAPATPTPVGDVRAADDPRFKNVVRKLGQNASKLKKTP